MRKKKAPDEIVLDLDATDIPLYGHQPERFFHGYYDRQLLLSALVYLRRRSTAVRAVASGEPGCGGRVAQLRAQWPKVKIVLRADSGFCRVIAKAEYLDKSENPRFVATSLSAEEWAAQNLYEKLYCARGEMENRIKEQIPVRRPACARADPTRVATRKIGDGRSHPLRGRR